jgi:hypothetical protein
MVSDKSGNIAHVSADSMNMIYPPKDLEWSKE